MTLLERIPRETFHEGSIPVLETKRLALRAPRLEDAKTVAVLANDRRIAENTARIPHPYKMSDAESFITGANKAGGEAVFLITLRGATIVGACGLLMQEQTPELGFWLGVPHWGQGYATEALHAVIDYAFNELPAWTGIGDIEKCTGEICIRGPQVMKGYWQLPAETAKVLQDGWLKTGDVGHINARGYVTITDRKKDMILVSGFNVYPNEIESVVAMHPGVLECAAVGVPDDKSGEAVKVVIVKKDPNLSTESVIEHCKRELTGYKIPKYVEFRDSLPKTPIGKILRRELRGK